MKALNEGIAIQLAGLIKSLKITPQEVVHMVVVSGGNHGDVACQFGATVHVETETEKISFGVSVLEVLCRADSAELLEKTG